MLVQLKLIDLGSSSDLQRSLENLQNSCDPAEHMSEKEPLLWAKLLFLTQQYERGLEYLCASCPYGDFRVDGLHMALALVAHGCLTLPSGLKHPLCCVFFFIIIRLHVHWCVFD